MLYWFGSHFFPSPADIEHSNKVSCPDSVDSHPAVFAGARALSGKTGCPKAFCLYLGALSCGLLAVRLLQNVILLLLLLVEGCFFFLSHFLLYSISRCATFVIFIPDTHMRSAMVIEIVCRALTSRHFLHAPMSLNRPRGWLLSL